MANPCTIYAIQVLSKFPKTQYELTQKCKTKGFSDEEMQQTITTLIQNKMLDDTLYAHMYLESECAKKGKPYKKIEAKLRSKGIDKDTIQKAYTEIQEEITIGAIQKIHKEITKNINKRKDKHIIIQKLRQKGYHIDQIKQAILLFNEENTHQL